jgi:hypothetical protein
MLRDESRAAISWELRILAQRSEQASSIPLLGQYFDLDDELASV